MVSADEGPRNMRTQHRTRMTPFLLLSIVGLILIGCSERIPGSKLYITGDSHAVGAEIYLDGERVGVMERRIYAGPSAPDDELRARSEMQRRLGLASASPMKPGDEFSVGVDLRVARGDKQTKYGVYDQVGTTWSL